MKTLSDLNMNYVEAPSDNLNEQIEGGAILQCSSNWTHTELQEWLGDYDFDMIEAVSHWLANEAQISEGQFLKVWVD